MGNTYTIAEVAQRSGFKPSTLRYYEELGLVPPVTRSPAGYRLYDDSSLARLAFVARAKKLGCTLDEIADLVTAWDSDRCEPVQVRLRDLVAAKITESRERAAAMIAFTAQLEQAAAALSDHTPDGPCDDTCGCAAAMTDTSIACTLDEADVPGRVAAWQAALASVVAREPIVGGLRLQLASHAAVGEVAALAAAEQHCCAFFRFDLTIDARGAALEITAPPEALDLVHSLFGAAA